MPSKQDEVYKILPRIPLLSITQLEKINKLIDRLLEETANVE